MRPILDESACATEGEAVEVRFVVGAKPREEREVVAALEDVDRVELQQSQPVDRRVQLANSWLDRARSSESLSGQSDASSLGGGHRLLAHLSTIARVTDLLRGDASGAAVVCRIVIVSQPFTGSTRDGQCRCLAS